MEEQVHMKTLNGKRTYAAHTCVAVCVSLMLILSGVFSSPAHAVTSEEKLAEADAIIAQIDSLQTELNRANQAYNAAVSEHEAAKKAMEEAQARAKKAQERIVELQERLGNRVSGMYKRGTVSFLDVLLEASTFEQFLTSVDMVNRINNQDAELVQETKEVRAEAEAAQAEYAAQKTRAADEMRKSEEARNTIATTQASLQNQVEQISAEAAELAAQETAAAEAAAHAAEEAAKASGNSNPGYTSGPSVVQGHGILAHPCPGASLSSLFGPRWGSMHNGIDLAAGEGTPYYAADAGTVLYATYDGGYNGGAGNWIVLAHGNGMQTVYMHSSAVFVSPGQQVSRGQNIGAVGNTGDSYGAHLHFEVRLGGSAVNPLNYL